MSVFAGGQRVNLNLFAVCTRRSFGDDMLTPSPNHGTQWLPNDDDDKYYVTLLHHLLLKQHRGGSCLQAIFVSDMLRIQARSLNNILIIGHLRDTDIRQCINNHTNLIYCVNSHIG